LDLFSLAFPQDYHLFQYRSAVGWVASLYSRSLRRGRSRHIALADALQWWQGYYHHPVELSTLGLAQLPAMLTSVQQLTISWLLLMDQYMSLRDQGLTMPAMRYEELDAEREAVVTAIFTQIGLPLATLSTALAAFDEDSQAGTRLARAASDKGAAFEFSAAELAEMHSILSRHPLIQSSDFIVPETILAE
jgi:hypothetical protein